ncbi:hypothetical protein RFI_19111, partial [Reticulomyxa filosa]
LLSESDLLSQLDQIVKVFAYVNDKDLFLEFYKKLLAKRLLTKKSINDHAEKHFVTKLKLRCGAQFTSKLEGMLKDMQRSTEHANKFERYIKDRRRELPYEFEPQILTSGFWPSIGNLRIRLPRSMMTGVDLFEEYFTSLHEKRKLCWLHDLGTLEIQGSFKETNKVVTFQVSTLQACILLIFNQIDSIRIADVIKMLECDPNQLKVQMKPLCSSQFPVLLKRPAKGYKTDDMFVFACCFFFFFFVDCQ